MAITANIAGGLVQLTGNPVRIHCTGGSIPAGASEYKILLKITSEDGKLEGAPFIDAIAPDGSGEAWFDISGYVNQPVKSVFQYPPLAAVKDYPTQAFNIQVQTGERYIDANDELIETWGTTSAIFQMLNGGLSPRQIAAMNATSDTFYSFYLEAGKFLTARPSGDVVHPTQPVKLWFMTVNDVSATYFVKANYDDGSNDTYSVPVTLNTNSLYEFNCNPAHFGIDLEPTGKKVEHFIVWLQNGETKISEEKVFYFDWRYCERPFFLLFTNTFGGVDDVYLGGFGKDLFATEGEIRYKPQERTATVYDPTLISTDKTGQNKWEINTGWKDLTILQYLRDLLVSRQAWFLYPNLSISHYIVIPVNIENADKLLLDRSQNLFSLDIEFSEAHKSKHSFDNRSF
jgi:hypothetical protein